MQFSFTKNPNKLQCPECGKDCSFEITKKIITCSNCKTESTVSANSIKLKTAGFYLIIITGMLAVFVNFSPLMLIVAVSSLLAGIVAIGYSNGEAKLVKINKNT